MTLKTTLLAAVFSATAAAASAVTIDITAFDASDFAALQSNITGVTEDFEGFNTSAGDDSFEAAGALSTAVGTFEMSGASGFGGGASIGLGDNVAVRDMDGLPFGDNYGRENTTPGGSMFLDSNDRQNMTFSVDTGLMFNTVLFTLMDASDTGSVMTVSVGGSTESVDLSSLSNANTLTVLVTFGANVSAADILLTNTIERDGFSIDDVTVGVVPVPAAGFLLLGGLGGLAALKRRKS